MNTELLVLAAKAAGYKIEAVGIENIYITGEGYLNFCWNSFNISGDAIKLAMKLVAEGKLRIQMTKEGIDLFEHWDGLWVPHTYTMDYDTPERLFRTAVTYVAAEIGKRV